MADVRRGWGKGSVRGLAVVVAVVALLGVAPPAQGQSAGTLAPPHDDAGVDLDADTYYDYLTVNARIDVTTAGAFFVSVDLWDNSGFNYITSATTNAVLPLGLGVVPLDLPGANIRASGYDGPYTADITLYDDMFMLLDMGVHMTQPYLATDFEPPGLAFSPPHQDSGVDSDGDSLFDALRVSWSVDVSDAGDYAFMADLFDPFFNWVDSVTVGVTLAAGPRSVDTDFTGWRIYQNGADGPFMAQVTAMDMMGNVVGSDFHTTAAYPWNQFDAPPFEFTPPHADGVEDLDGDMLYDVLDVNWSADVGVSGTYEVSVTLYDSSFNWIDQYDEARALPSGSQVVTTPFDGWVIRQHGVDGPYTASAYVYNATGVMLGNDVHTTAAYAWADFETPPAALNPPHFDAGVDTDGNTLFDAIRIDVNLTVDIPGSYEVDVALYDAMGMNLLGQNWTTETLPAGPETVALGFSTLPMQATGIGGPYEARINLYEAERGRSLDSGFHVTRAYAVAEFDPLPAEFSPPHWDQGVDRDAPPDGQFNVLEATINVTVFEAGAFAVIGQLYDASGMTPLGQDIFIGFLPAGDQSVVLDYSGVTLRQMGIDGPYLLDLALYAPATTFPVEIDRDTHTTQAYAWTDFQAVVPAYLTGTVRDRTTGTGIDSAMITALDYRNEVMINAMSMLNGVYNMSLYPGDWVVVFMGGMQNAELARTTVTAPTTVLDADLWPYVGTSTTVDITMRTWQTADWSNLDLIESNNRTFRLSFDWQYGNRDQILSQQEWDSYLALVGFAPPSPPPADSVDEFLVDGRSYGLVAGSDDYQFRDIPGSIDSTTVPGLLQSASYANPSIPSTPTHVIDVNADYDQFWWSYGYRVTLPAGFVLRSYTAPPEVRVSGIGSGFVTVDAGMDPAPADMVYSVWVHLQIGDGVPPTAEAGPDRAILEGDSVTFDGTGSTDNDQIAGYWWNFTDGGAQSLSGATPSYTFSTAGTYVVTLTVVDRAGLSSTDTITVRVSPPTGAIDGTVTGTGSAPIAGATVRLLNGTAEVDRTTANASGGYAFADVPPGSYTLRFTAAGYDAAERSVTVVAGETAHVNVQLTATQRPQGNPGLPDWLWIVVVVVVVAVVASLALLLARRRKSTAAAPAAPPAGTPATPPTTPPEEPKAPPPPPS